jgi:predicted nucleic acid-binding protein
LGGGVHPALAGCGPISPPGTGTTQVRTWFDQQLGSRGIAICDPVRLELLHSTRTLPEFQALRGNLGVLPTAPVTEGVWSRAMDVYELLAGVSPQWHRSGRHSDLLIAAAAEAAGLTLVHYDRDFDSIGAVTRQPMRWVSPWGSL